MPVTGNLVLYITVTLSLQSLIRSALRASSPALAASLRRVLDGLHSQRLTPGTDAMMLRLYHPLLFRDLAAANAGVRNNAMHLLVEVFPLQDSSAPPEVRSQNYMQAHCTLLYLGCQRQPPLCMSGVVHCILVVNINHPCAWVVLCIASWLAGPCKLALHYLCTAHWAACAVA